ncbi:MAG TPA: hypothetical protein DEP66_06290 [Acidimicrobiaceae bacterium]|nr:hypothetical protein [Acidimicrobiaceae bacterium]
MGAQLSARLDGSECTAAPGWLWERRPAADAAWQSTSGTATTYAPVNDDVGNSLRAVASDTTRVNPDIASPATAAVPNPAPTVSGDSAHEVEENTVAVGTYTATDDGDAFTWAVSGADGRLFAIADGVLTFSSPPDVEDPNDDGSDNVYNVEIIATDTGTPPQPSAPFSVAVTVTDTSRPCTVTVSDADGNNTPTVGEVLTAGVADGAAGSECPEPGEWRWESTRDPANPAWTPTATPDGTTYTPTEADEGYVLRVVLHNVPAGEEPIVSESTRAVPAPNQAPVIRGENAPAVVELNVEVGTYTATDDGGGGGLTWTISGGTDADLFDISAGGELSFTFLPDYESPFGGGDRSGGGDGGGGGGVNVYGVVITVTDAGIPPLTSAPFPVAVTVTDTTLPCTVDVSDADADGIPRVGEVLTAGAVGTECPRLVWRWQRTRDPANPAWTLTGGPMTGVTYTPTEADVDYVLRVVLHNDNVPAGEDPIVSESTPAVPAPNRAPMIQGENTRAVVENTVEVDTFTATDDGGPDALIWGIFGGADESLFDISAVGGELTFKAAPDYEAPADTGSDNIYDVVIAANDSGIPQQTSALFPVAVTVTDTSRPCTVTVGDADGNNTPTVGEVLTAGVADGADGSECPRSPDWRWDRTSSAGTPAWTPTATPDGVTYTPTEADVGYVLRVVLDNDNVPAGEAPIVSESTRAVPAPNQAPTIGGDSDPEVVENTVRVGTFTATDDGDSSGLIWEISGGADESLFDISADGGALSFRMPPNYEGQLDAGRNNVYNLEIAVTDAGTPPLTSEPFLVAVEVTDAIVPCEAAIDNLAPEVGNELLGSFFHEAVDSECGQFGARWQWERSADDGGTWSDITGATAPRYTTTDDDVGNILRVVFTRFEGATDIGIAIESPSTAAVSALLTFSSDNPDDLRPVSYILVVRLRTGTITAGRVKVGVFGASEGFVGKGTNNSCGSHACVNALDGLTLTDGGFSTYADGAYLDWPVGATEVRINIHVSSAASFTLVELHVFDGSTSVFSEPFRLN